MKKLFPPGNKLGSVKLPLFYQRVLWMKISITFLLFSILGLQLLMANDGYGQSLEDEIVTLEVKGSYLSKVLTEIEKQTDYRFAYNADQIAGYRVDLDLGKRNLEETLNLILADKPLQFKVVKDKFIVLSKVHKRIGSSVVRPLSTFKLENQVLKALPLNVSGKVTDEAGEPLIGVNIQVKGNNKGTSTDLEGNFKLDDINENTVLVISYVGYQTQEVAVGGKLNLTIILLSDSQLLDEVIVVGYGTMKKSDLTGAVASISSEKLLKTLSPTPQQALAGKLAGVNIQQNTAQPGAGVSISIRGNSQPLFVVDGMPISTGVTVGSGSIYNAPSPDGFNFINPEDIESIEVLKDAASTAIYGARGSNGVVLITTKSGKNGKGVIEINSKIGFQNLLDNAEMMDAKQYAIEVNKYRNSIELEPSFTDSQIQSFGTGTNWLDEISRTGKYSEHNLSFRGGGDQTNYFTSVNILGQDGVVKESDFNRYTGRLNLNTKGERYRLSLRSTFAVQNKNSVPTNTGSLYQDASMLQLAREFIPTLPIKDANGRYSLNNDAPYFSNPVSLLNISDKEEKDKLLANASFEYDIIDGLFAKVELGLEKEFVERTTYLPLSTLEGEKQNGRAYIARNQLDNNRIYASLNYVKTFGEHSINSILGTERQSTRYRWRESGGSDFPSDVFLWNNLALSNKDRQWLGSGQNEIKWLSYLGRVNYVFRDKYLLTGIFRYDGSPKFRGGNKFLFYPSFSAGWRLSEEDFFDSGVVSNMKFRASWGQTGQDNIPVEDTYPLLNIGKLVFGDKGVFYAGQSGLINPNLQWQVDEEVNFGFDFGLFNNRIDGFFDLFSKTRNNMLSFMNIGPDKGYTGVRVNKGKQRNRGWEFSVNGKIFTEGKFKWDAGFNVFQNTWRWVERTNDDPLLFVKKDDPLDAIYAFEVDGVIKDENDIPNWMPNAIPGIWKIVDVHGRDAEGDFTEVPDGKITSVDRKYLGTSQPRWNWGFSSYFTYDRFSLNFTVQAMMDRVAYNSFRAYFAHPYRLFTPIRNMLTEVVDRWTPKNPNGPIGTGYPSSYDFTSLDNSYYYEDASFIRAKNITLMYDLPVVKWGIPIASLNIYFDVQNPLLITKYKYMDPETAGSQRDPYPNTRTYLLGLNVKF